jgi:cyanophycinase
MSCLALLLLLALVLPSRAQSTHPSGLEVFGLAAAQPTPSEPPTFALALVGGGGDVDEAMQYLCQHSGGGNIVVLRSSGTDAYNPYFHTLCPHNSVTTLLITSPEGASDPAALQAVRDAHAIFIAGGDQSNYIKFWPGPLLQEINLAISRSVPIGGISAGLAVLGEFVFSARLDTVTSQEAVVNPYDPKVTLDRNFLSIPLLNDIITDSHFMARQRMGRTLVFLSRIVQDGWADRARAIGIDEGTAVLIDAQGAARVVGKGAAYFVQLRHKPEVCLPGKPLTLHSFTGFRVTADGSNEFDVKSWLPGNDAKPIYIQVTDGLTTITSG